MLPVHIEGLSIHHPAVHEKWCPLHLAAQVYEALPYMRGMNMALWYLEIPSIDPQYTDPSPLSTQRHPTLMSNQNALFLCKTHSVLSLPTSGHGAPVSLGAQSGNPGILNPVSLPHGKVYSVPSTFNTVLQPLLSSLFPP